MKEIHKLDLEKGVQYWVKPKNGGWFVGVLDGAWMVSKIREIKLEEVEEVRVLQDPDEINDFLEQEREAYWTEGAKHGCDCI